MRGYRAGSEYNYINRKDVQADLKVTADQATKITAAQQAERDAFTAMRDAQRNSAGAGGTATTGSGAGTSTSGGTGTSGAARNGGNRQNRTPNPEMTKITNDYHAAIDEILSAEQKARLKQIAIQMGGGILAIESPDIQKDLGLSSTKVAKIKELQTAAQTANQGIFQRERDGDLDRQTAQADMQKNDVALKTELAKVLSPAETQRFADMQGPKFNQDPNERSGFGGFGGGRRGGNRGAGGNGGGGNGGGGGL